MEANSTARIPTFPSLFDFETDEAFLNIYCAFRVSRG
jgi:hypothetical protein